MRSSMRAAASWVVDGTNSDGQRRSTNGWAATKPYGMMDHPLNELFLWFRVQSLVPNEWTFALMRSSMRAAASWVVDGTNSDGQRQSTHGWAAAKPYGMMDHPLN